MKWYPIEYNSDPKVQALSPIADLVYRRLMDLIWQSDECRFPMVYIKLYRAVGRGLTQDEFSEAWLELQHDGFEAISVSNDGRWISHDRLTAEFKKSKQCAEAGRKGGLKKRGGAIRKKPRSSLPTTHDEKGTIAVDPGRRSTSETKGGFFDEIKRQNSEDGLSDAARRRLKGDG